MFCEKARKLYFYKKIITKALTHNYSQLICALNIMCKKVNKKNEIILNFLE